MIRNSWKNTVFKCDTCGEAEFSLDSSLKYVCPVCKNKFSYIVVEKILDKLSNLEAERYKNAEVGSLIGEKFVIDKNVLINVLEDDGQGGFVLGIKVLK